MSMPAEQIRARITLDALLEGIADAPPLPISGIATDSRRVRAGNAFLACQGETSHGIEFSKQAIDNGAAAIVADADTADGLPDSAGVPLIAAPGLAKRIGDIANRFFDSPSRAVRVTGVTGTNGKTTVAWLIRQCMNLLHSSCGYIGTLGSGLGSETVEGTMTTPACVELHEMLADFRDKGATHAAIEVSSHALEQRRVDGVQFDAAIFTNLSRDHIDYHGSMRAYGETKASLFLDHDVRARIVSLDTEFGAELADRCGANVITVSTRFDRVANGRPFVFVRSVVATPAGSNVAINSAWGDAEFEVPLPGDFNVANAATVLALLLANDVPLADACRVLGQVTAPAGRMQRIAVPGELPQVFVDYSHTPASLEAALKALRSHCRGRLWCVFGCGGDRDRGKRPEMGAIVERLADHAVVTSDNPRGESPIDIIDDILGGMQAPGNATVIEDRAAAIDWAIAHAADDDQILIAGKGHEEFQVIGSEAIPFSDYAVAKQGLDARSAGSAG